MKIFYSVFSGLIYEVFDAEVNNLDEGQIPLKKKPHHSCKKCYGRGFSQFDRDRNIYLLCSCMKKCIEDGYTPKEIKLLPKI